MGRTQIESYGENEWRSDIPVVRVYKEFDADPDDRDAAASGVDGCFSEMYSNGKIPGYEVLVYNCTFVRNDEDTGAVAEFAEFCKFDYNNFTEDGVHIIIHDKDAQNPGASLGGPAWEDNAYAQAAVSKQSGDLDLQETVNHELAHQFIKIDLKNVQEIIEDNNNLHELGTIEYNSIYNYTQETPLSALDSHEAGDCSSDRFRDTYTVSYTSCTQDAYDYTHADIY